MYKLNRKRLNISRLSGPSKIAILLRGSLMRKMSKEVEAHNEGIPQIGVVS